MCVPSFVFFLYTFFAFKALSDKSMMYGPGLMTSGKLNAPGSNFAGSGGMSSMTSGPFANNGMSASMFPAGLSTNDRGIPSGLSNANSGMSPFSGSSSMKGGSNRSPFNMAMLSMQSQANLSPSMGGSTSLNSGSSVNSKTRDNWGKLGIPVLQQYEAIISIYRETSVNSNFN